MNEITFAGYENVEVFGQGPGRFWVMQHHSCNRDMLSGSAIAQCAIIAAHSEPRRPRIWGAASPWYKHVSRFERQTKSVTCTYHI